MQRGVPSRTLPGPTRDGSCRQAPSRLHPGMGHGVDHAWSLPLRPIRAPSPRPLPTPHLALRPLFPSRPLSLPSAQPFPFQLCCLKLFFPQLLPRAANEKQTGSSDRCCSQPTHLRLPADPAGASPALPAPSLGITILPSQRHPWTSVLCPATVPGHLCPRATVPGHRHPAHPAPSQGIPSLPTWCCPLAPLLCPATTWTPNSTCCVHLWTPPPCLRTTISRNLPAVHPGAITRHLHLPTCHHPRASSSWSSSTIPGHLHPALPAPSRGISMLPVSHCPQVSLSSSSRHHLCPSPSCSPCLSTSSSPQHGHEPEKGPFSPQAPCPPPAASSSLFVPAGTRLRPGPGAASGWVQE